MDNGADRAQWVGMPIDVLLISEVSPQAHPVLESRRTETVPASMLEWSEDRSAEVPYLPILPDKDLTPVPMLPVSAVQTVLYGGGKTRGKLFFRNALPNNLGLVVICHGVITTTDEMTPKYRFAMDHLGIQLASSGFVAISIDHHLDGADAAAETIIANILWFMDYFGVALNLIGRPLALLGHSEGATGSIRAANLIRAGAAGKYFTSAKSVVALAPSFRDASDQIIPTGYTDSLLIMAGTHDGDPNAQGGTSLVYFPESSFPKPESPLLKGQYFLWCFGFNHAYFASGAVEAYDQFNYDKKDEPNIVSPLTQQTVAKNYVAMFLLWQLAAKTEYKKVFVGLGKIQWSGITPPPVVLPRFDSVDNVSFGNAVTFKDFYTTSNLTQIIDQQHPAKFGKLNMISGTCMYQTAERFEVSWNRNIPEHSSPLISVDFDPDILTMGISSIDFDALQINNSVLNHQGFKLSLSVWFRHKSLPFLKSTSVVVNIEPSLFVWSKSIFNVPLFRSVLGTIRIPVTRFGLEGKWKDYTKFQMDFAAASYPSGRIAFGGFRGSF